MNTITRNSYSFVLDGKGGASLSDFDHGLKKGMTQWINIDYKDEDAKEWLKNKSGLSEFICEAMLAKDVRPRTMLTSHGLLIILRSINFHSGEEPDDMLSIRIWLENDRVITSSVKQLLSLDEIKNALASHNGPRTMVEFVDEVSERITDQISSYIEKIDNEIILMEREFVEMPTREIRHKLAEVRSQIIAIRRYISPQRDVLSRLTQIDSFEWLSKTDRFHFMETSDRTIRCLEDLDESRDRAAVINETISNRMSEQVGQRIYVLSMIAAIFLPLGFVTSLLGINVGGIPGSEAKWAFVIVILILFIIAFFEYLLFKRKQWL